jgi:hypothetical protein
MVVDRPDRTKLGELGFRELIELSPGHEDCSRADKKDGRAQ